MTIFGGIMTTSVDPQKYGLDKNYIMLNYNDFFNALIFVFH